MQNPEPDSGWIRIMFVTQRTGLIHRARKKLTIGRSPDSDITLPDIKVSRRHAKIYRHAGRYFIRDLGSKNGTFVNGLPIRKRTEIAAGDFITVGSTVLVLWSQQQEGGHRPNLRDDLEHVD